MLAIAFLRGKATTYRSIVQQTTNHRMRVMVDITAKGGLYGSLCIDHFVSSVRRTGHGGAVPVLSPRSEGDRLRLGVHCERSTARWLYCQPVVSRRPGDRWSPSPACPRRRGRLRYPCGTDLPRVHTAASGRLASCFVRNPDGIVIQAKINGGLLLFVSEKSQARRNPLRASACL
jgi:hypothetical protein